MWRPHRRDQGSSGSRDGTRRDSDLGFANWPDSFFLKLKGGQQAPESYAEDQLWARRWQEAGRLVSALTQLERRELLPSRPPPRRGCAVLRRQRRPEGQEEAGAWQITLTKDINKALVLLSPEATSPVNPEGHRSPLPTAELCSSAQAAALTRLLWDSPLSPRPCGHRLGPSLRRGGSNVTGTPCPRAGVLSLCDSEWPVTVPHHSDAWDQRRAGLFLSSSLRR